MSPSCLSQFSSVAFLWRLSVTVRGIKIMEIVKTRSFYHGYWCSVPNSYASGLQYVYERTGFFLLLPLFFFFWRLGKLRKVEKVVLAWQPELLSTNWIMGCFGIKDLSFVYGSGKSSLTSFGWNCNAVFQAKQILQKHLNLSLRRKDSVLNDE